ncbi:hypothetical protein [Nocardia terpenica]|uniref:Uncharacterized protein n=1 Tax=Nocardia terpenica TaxID=455432 RepID=A0A164HFF2_9NOCA|nr:hypothetical protein [Nocardia terpenica]KZM68466.1 hypothetical protein AWN90_11385 [Nocardia terpenica]NQE88586.1 hypothetical protein [Nocardia terpenica]
MTELDELMDLIHDTPDVIYFLRAQMTNNARAADGRDWTDTERPTPDRVASSKTVTMAPCSLDAMSAADAEVSVLANWGDRLGVIYTGRVWRSHGVVRGLAGDDLTVVWSLVEGFTRWAREGWTGNADMLNQLRSVRNRHRKQWGDLDLLLMHRPESREQSWSEPGLF